MCGPTTVFYYEIKSFFILL